VGGGPAGSTCAWGLRRAGLDVLVLDRAAFPRDKPCAGWITPPVLEALGLPAEEYREGRVLQEITGLRTSLLGGAAIETRYPRPVSFGIRRCEFDAYLLRRSGAPTRTEHVTGLRRAGGSWIVNEAFRAPVLIGAGGHFCPVARLLHGRPERDVVVAAQEVEFPMDERQRSACPVRPEVPELFFCADRRGYGWCFRKGDFLNVGFGRQDPEGLGARVRAFVERLRVEGRLPAGTPSRWRGHAYLLNRTARRPLAGDGVLLLGDAAGLAYSESGEGIRPAVESALLAVRAVLDAGGRHAREDLEPYAEAARRRFGPRGTRGPGSTPLPAFASALAGWLLGNPWFTRHVLIERWFLHAHEEALPRAV
ncbi:MAG TPA: NAD(P)/FAD-dependent oxidoreductase, partial [Vicinamibacteria bacterium]|nr:NAD(P)/FAD-dependent oxidoreductase [Vicinamibacteria bacterium]